MKRFITIALLTLLVAATAQAKLGETLPQLVKRFGQYEATPITGLYIFRPWGDKKGYVVAILTDGYCVVESYVSGSPLVNGEPPTPIVRGILNTNSPRDKWHEVKGGNYVDDLYALQNKNGSITAILDWCNAEQKAEGGIWVMDIGYTSVLDRLEAALAAQNPGAEVDPSRPPQDCGIIAAQAYDKLKSTTAWCRIIGIEWPTGSSTQSSRLSISLTATSLSTTRPECMSLKPILKMRRRSKSRSLKNQKSTSRRSSF